MIQVTFQYKPLFKVDLEHLYYQDKVMKNVSVIPTSETLKLLSQNDLLFKATKEGFEVLADYDMSEKLLKRVEQMLDQKKKLSFMLFSKDAVFKIYSNVPFDTSGKIFHFSNAALKDKTEGMLHEGKEVSEKDLKDYNVVPDTGEENYLIQNFGFEGQEKNSYEMDKNAVSAILPDGSYSVLKGKKIQAEFIRISEKTKGEPLAYVELELNNTILNSIKSALEIEETKSFIYKIIFKPRAIKWRYTIIPVRQKRTTGLKIVSQAKSSKIKFQENKKAEKAEEQIVFESNADIEFTELYQEGFQLKRGGSNENDGKTLIKKLPYPALDMVKPLGKDQYYSEMLIYI